LPTRSPLTRSVPCSAARFDARTWPASALSTDVLPEPDGPMIASIRPPRARPLTPSRIGRPLTVNVRSFHSISGGDDAAASASADRSNLAIAGDLRVKGQSLCEELSAAQTVERRFAPSSASH